MSAIGQLSFFVLKEISIALKRTFANSHYRPIPDGQTTETNVGI